jgi:hypothetical protein
MSWGKKLSNSEHWSLLFIESKKFVHFNSWHPLHKEIEMALLFQRLEVDSKETWHDEGCAFIESLSWIRPHVF